MKTYEEMAQSALMRGKAVRKQRRKTKRIYLGTISGLTVCALVILLALGIAGQGPFPGTADSPLNYGQVSFLTADHKKSVTNTGNGFQYIAGTRNPGGSGLNYAPPRFEFQCNYINVVAKAVEEYPGIYETLNEYGSTQTYQYRLLRMEVIDPLESGMEGAFLYLLPIHLKGDLTAYDSLLISMMQLPKNYVLQTDEQLAVFEYLFADPFDTPELGNIIAFNNGVFDESLWQDRSWFYGYQFAGRMLDWDKGDLLVSRGSTLEEALQRRKEQIAEMGDRYQVLQVNHFDFQTEAAQEAMNYLKPFENGIFVPERIMARYRQDYGIRRYINGCPTNEQITINADDETVEQSQYRFEDADFEKLPDLSTYIESLNLSKIAPQHTDPTGKILIYNTAVGWYEKTEDGVYSIVRIAWRYFDEDDYYIEYYDETFILLHETGDYIISREDLIKLIGQNHNISNKKYGEAISRPM